MSFSYVAFGDSLTVGVGSSFFSPGFVQRYKRMAERALDEQLHLFVFAKSGYQTEDILKELKDELICEKIREAEIITITAGGNDLINAARQFLRNEDEKALKEALKKSKKHMGEIVGRVEKIKKGCNHPYIMRILNLYNPFPKVDLAEKWVVQYNSFLKEFSRKPTILIADIYKAFKDNEADFLSIDGVHPNDTGYDRMAEKLHILGFGDILSIEDEE